jgi:ADP-ribosylglycohydrolase
MLGVIAGDVIGSIHELIPIKSTAFPLFDEGSRFTDDTVLTVATASAILTGQSFEAAYLDFGRRYPRAGYGASFRSWLRMDQPRPYGSFGNGSAMRVAPVGFAFDDERTVLAEAGRSAEVTHNHVEGVKGAQAVALAVFKARTGSSKEEIREAMMSRFDYDLERTIEEIRPGYTFDVTCQGSVPEAITAFLDSTSTLDAIRLAVSLGGDSDTLAAIAGGIAHAFYKEIPADIVGQVRERLPGEFIDIIDAFEDRFGIQRP